MNVAEFLNICYKRRIPRQARIDVPGHLYHVIARGIERGKIFVDGEDYADFLSRLEKKLDKTGSKWLCFQSPSESFSSARLARAPASGRIDEAINDGLRRPFQLKAQTSRTFVPEQV